LVDSSFSLYTGFYNIKNSHWEPLIEPWSFNVKVSRALVSESLEIDVSSKRKLEINIEHTFLESMLNFSNGLGDNTEVNIRNKAVDCNDRLLISTSATV
jgi:vacuolar protein sorting-associated protein 13A/C